MGKDDIGIFEFIFHGLPELPELEGVDEDRLRELQNAVQEQLHQRDEERERNITKRVQEFKKTFVFVNSHLLKGVATMAELTKTDNRQPMGKIKPTDKMVMMLSLFDCTKPAMSKQHYERFNLYINFQTKGGHLTDPVEEGIDLFEHMLGKTPLVWFQMNRSKFKDLTMLKTTHGARQKENSYNHGIYYHLYPQSTIVYFVLYERSHNLDRSFRIFI